MGGSEAGPSMGSVRGRGAGGGSSGDRRGCGRPMLWRHIGIVGPSGAVSGDSGWRIGVRGIRSRRLGVCCWGVSIRIGAGLTRIVVGHEA